MSELQAYIDARNAKTRAWIDEDPKNRFAGLIPDAEFWADMEIYTVAQFERQELETTIWDLYKEIHGISPRWMDINSMSDDQLRKEVDGLLDELKERQAQESRFIQQAINDFESNIATLISIGAKDRETAIRWLRDAHDDKHALTDDSYFEYLYGIPYGYLARNTA